MLGNKKRAGGVGVEDRIPFVLSLIEKVGVWRNISTVDQVVDANASLGDVVEKRSNRRFGPNLAREG